MGEGKRLSCYCSEPGIQSTGIEQAFTEHPLNAKPWEHGANRWLSSCFLGATLLSHSHPGACIAGQWCLLGAGPFSCPRVAGSRFPIAAGPHPRTGSGSGNPGRKLLARVPMVCLTSERGTDLGSQRAGGMSRVG